MMTGNTLIGYSQPDLGYMRSFHPLLAVIRKYVVYRVLEKTPRAITVINIKNGNVTTKYEHHKRVKSRTRTSVVHNCMFISETSSS